jgi:HD superfamily phosphohydrolase YqeK
MDKTIPKLRSAMKKIMDEKRYEHTLGVAYTSADLAACHGENPEVGS